jgi:hypothetical protein
MQVAKIFVISSAVAAVVLLAATVPVLLSQPASATPAFTKQTGKPCSQCHQNANGTGGLTDFGQKFKANGDK